MKINERLTVRPLIAILNRGRGPQWMTARVYGEVWPWPTKAPV